MKHSVRHLPHKSTIRPFHDQTPSPDDLESTGERTVVRSHLAVGEMPEYAPGLQLHVRPADRFATALDMGDETLRERAREPAALRRPSSASAVSATLRSAPPAPVPLRAPPLMAPPLMPLRARPAPPPRPAVFGFHEKLAILAMVFVAGIACGLLTEAAVATAIHGQSGTSRFGYISE